MTSESEGFELLTASPLPQRPVITGPMALDPELFKKWLRNTGWIERSRGRLGSLYELRDVTVAIPDELPSDPLVAKDVAERVASAMDRSIQDVWKRLGSPLTDRIELRLVGPSLSSGRIPLGAATEALRNARKMLSATGTSVVSPARSIARRYRPEAQFLARDAELAHTEDGSFVFPLYIALGGAVEDLSYAAEDVIIEPYERTVTRALATALHTAVDLSSESVERLSEQDLDHASSVGVSREFCVAMVDLMKSDSVEKVDINFDWSHAYASTDALPKTVEVHRARRPQLRKLAHRLGKAAPIDPTVYSGNILEIGHDQENPELFFFVLDTYFRARRTTLRVTLTAEQHESAIPWYRDRATVVVRGFATEGVGSLSMPRPDMIQAWGSDRL